MARGEASGHFLNENDEMAKAFRQFANKLEEMASRERKFGDENSSKMPKCTKARSTLPHCSHLEHDPGGVVRLIPRDD